MRVQKINTFQFFNILLCQHIAHISHLLHFYSMHVLNLPFYKNYKLFFLLLFSPQKKRVVNAEKFPKMCKIVYINRISVKLKNHGVVRRNFYYYQKLFSLYRWMWFLPLLFTHVQLRIYVKAGRQQTSAGSFQKYTKNFYVFFYNLMR